MESYELLSQTNRVAAGLSITPSKETIQMVVRSEYVTLNRIV